METLPKEIIDAWNNKEDAVVLTTVNRDGMPNSIYATCVSLYKDKKILIADNYFNKTRVNILNGSKGCVLFITKEGKSYQIKGLLDYCKNGYEFEDMKKWNPEKHPGHAVVGIMEEEIYSGADLIN